MRTLYGLTIVLSLAMAGCSSAPIVVDDKFATHMINIDRNGNYVAYEEDSTDYGANEEQYIQAFDQAMEGETEGITNFREKYGRFLVRLFNSIRDHPSDDPSVRKLLIYVHGGLNSVADGIRRTKTQYQKIKDDQYFPIFINWRSAGLETYGRHLWRIRQGEKSDSAKYTFPVYLVSDVLGSIGYAPKSLVVQGKHSIDSITMAEDEYFDDKVDKGCFNIYYADDFPADANSLRSVCWFLTIPAKLVTTPFVYTMSKPAWDVMLRRTYTMIRKPSEYTDYRDWAAEDLEKWQKYYPAGTGALAEFLTRLRQFEKDNPFELEITLCGHSMGTIVCNEIVSLFHDLNFTKIIHMASADSVRNFFQKTIPYLEDNEDSRFYGLYLDPENEDRELNIGGVVPSGSLLTWIDNNFTTPATEIDRRAGRWSNMYQTLYRIPTDVNRRVYFKIFGKGKENGPQMHGDFDNFEYWKPEFYWNGSEAAPENDCD